MTNGPLPWNEFSKRVRACQLCKGRYFDHEPRPTFSAEISARVLIVGQAPGRRVYETGQPWNDPSGDTLREWMGVSREQFYRPDSFAILPTALCFPGSEKGKGDLPPPPICAPTWHPQFAAYLKPEITLLIGQYAQAYYLGKRQPVSAVVEKWEAYLQEGWFVLPHPSPRNRKWLTDRPWFHEFCIPALRRVIKPYLD